MGEEICEFCGKSYKTKRWLTNHINTKHSGLTEGSGTYGKSATTNHEDNSASSNNPSSIGTATECGEDEAANEELAAAQSLDWGDWSGTDDEEEVETYCSIVLDPWREDEVEEQLREVNAGVATVDLNPVKKTPKPVIAKCKDCRDSTFTTIEGYVKHRVGHGMQAALLRIPTLEEVIPECADMLGAVCAELQDMKITTGFGPTVITAAGALKEFRNSEVLQPILHKLCERFLEFMQDKSSFLFPSAFANAFLVHNSYVVLDQNIRASLTSAIVNVTHVEVLLDNSAACNMLVTNIIMKFGSKLLARLLRTLCKGVGEIHVPHEERYAVTYQSVLSLDFKQNMHYIGGSNVKSILKTALRVKHRNEEWQRVMTTIKNNFLISDFSAAPDSELMAWTDSLDRGKLTKISAKAPSFFVQLGTEVKPLERLDGSLLNDEVLEKVVSSPALLLRWDELKGNLTEKESFKLLHAIIHQFCITWRNGIIGRRHDELAVKKAAKKFGTGGLAFRSRLGGK